ncbi:MAG: PASTA domain-containing protein [Acidobacteriota bacterium]|nr:PASTA domain-containing protein [Acidobacteriota bacterium]
MDGARRLDGRWMRSGGVAAACALTCAWLAATWLSPGVAAAETARDTVHFDSTMVDEFPGNENGPHGKFTNEYTATVPLTAPSRGAPYTGSATGSYARAEGVTELVSECHGGTETNKLIEQSGSAAPFKVVSFAAGASPVLTINVGAPSENYLAEGVGPCAGPPQGTATPNWWALWTASHRASLLTSEANEFQLTLTKGGGEVAATATYSGVVEQQGNLIGTESTSITVTEAPCTVPDVVGEPLALAEEAIEEAGCTVGAVTEKKSMTVALGEVMSTSPAAGASVAAGTAVSLVIAKGGRAARKCIVPSLKGLTLVAAKQALKHAECALGRVKKKGSKTLAKGLVISSRPKAGKKKKAEYKVDLVLSKGPGKQCKVPSLKGDTVAGATAALRKAGCSLGRVSTEKSSSVAAGQVISSQPKKGSKLKAGSKVALVISIGKA